MPVTTDNIRDAFRQRTTHSINELRRQLMDMEAESRISVILRFGVEEFIRQWAEIVEVRRARGDFRITERTGGHRDPTEEEAWRDYGYHYLEMFAGGPSGDRRIQGPLLDFNRVRGAAAAAQQTASQEPLWKTYWDRYFRLPSFSHPVHGSGVVAQTGDPHCGPRDAPNNGGVARLSLWTLDHWAQFVDHAAPHGAGAHGLQREPGHGVPWEARRSETWNRSLWVLSEDANTRRQGLNHGLSYFREVYRGYAFAFGQLCSDALVLEDAVRRRRREPRTESRMQNNLRLWRAGLNVTLTPPNLQRFRNIERAWQNHWSRRTSLGITNASLRPAGLEIASGGGLGLILWNLEAR